MNVHLYRGIVQIITAAVKEIHEWPGNGGYSCAWRINSGERFRLDEIFHNTCVGPVEQSLHTDRPQNRGTAQTQSLD